MFKRKGSSVGWITPILLVGPAMTARAETQAQRRVRLFQETQIVAVMDLAAPASEYEDDGDPNTQSSPNPSRGFSIQPS